jgi:pimeloyl-ACP methyl ester carboxylesterase
MPQIALNESVISYDDYGQGEPALLLLPPYCANRTVFRNVLPFWGSRRRILTLDWRGHGGSGSSGGDYGIDGLLEDAMTVLNVAGVQQVVPVALSSAGWVAIELRRWMGNRIPKLVLLDWLMTETPADSLAELQAPGHWRQAVDETLVQWLRGADNQQVQKFVREEVGVGGFYMWARAARAVSKAYRELGSPFRLLAHLRPCIPVLHLYAEANEPGYVAIQRSFAAKHRWYRAHKLRARSHFPTFEAPEQIARLIEQFVAPGHLAHATLD